MLRLALAAATLTPILHCIVLFASGQDAVRDPVSELSRNDLGWLHTLGLIAFGVAHVALVATLAGRDRGLLWPWGRGLVIASGAMLFYVAFYFISASESTLRGADANDPLWIVASLIGLAMGALQPGLSRISRPLGLFSAGCLGIWLWLVPLILLVDETWLGAYERIVGTVYVVWIVGLVSALLKLDAKPAGVN